MQTSSGEPNWSLDYYNAHSTILTFYISLEQPEGGETQGRKRRRNGIISFLSFLGSFHSRKPTKEGASATYDLSKQRNVGYNQDYIYLDFVTLKLDTIVAQISNLAVVFKTKIESWATVEFNKVKLLISPRWGFDYYEKRICC